jgi:hypothetical protein
VKDSNDDPEFIAELVLKIRYSSRPRILRNWHRLVGQVLFGVFYRSLIYNAIPWESSVIYISPLIVPLGTAFGTYMVSNVGRQKSPFFLSLIGAYIGEFLLGEPHLVLGESRPFLVAGVSMIFSTSGWEWRRKKEDMPFKNIVVIGLTAYGVFVCVCGSYIYWNATLETVDGDNVKVYYYLKDQVFNSEHWKKFKTTLLEFPRNCYESWRIGGFEGAKKYLFELIDLEGEYDAYDTLGVERGAAFEEVRKRYKELATKWHPDHHKGEEMKMKVQDKMIQYNKAYKVLEGIHKERKQ